MRRNTGISLYVRHRSATKYPQSCAVSNMVLTNRSKSLDMNRVLIDMFIHACRHSHVTGQRVTRQRNAPLTYWGTLDT